MIKKKNLLHAKCFHRVPPHNIILFSFPVQILTNDKISVKSYELYYIFGKMIVDC